MFRLIGIFIRQILLTPVNKVELRCLLIFFALGLGIMIYAIIRANGYLGFPESSQTDSYFKAAFDFWGIGVLLPLILKTIRTDREMSTKIIYNPY